MSKPAVCIVSPASRADNNGNWRTADRWKAHLQALAQVDLRQEWDGQPADALIALHARRSAASIERFRRLRPGRPIVLVLTGTDVYRDIDTDPDARRSLALADRIVCLQPLAIRRLDTSLQSKAVAIVQGAKPLERAIARQPGHFVAVGHLRSEKDPLTLMRAVRRLPGRLHVLHIGAALDESLAAAARALMRDCPNYQWSGAMAHDSVRERIASATALVHMSRLEGGANVVVEAIVSGTPVIASRIDGNVGLLTELYAGYFPVGDSDALAALMIRCDAEPEFAALLSQQCARLAPAFTDVAEGERLRRLLAGCLGGGGGAAWTPGVGGLPSND